MVESRNSVNIDAIERYYIDIEINDDTALWLISDWYRESIMDTIKYDLKNMMMMVEPILPHQYDEQIIDEELERLSYKEYYYSREYRVRLPLSSDVIYLFDKDLEFAIASSEEGDPHLPALKKMYAIFHEPFLDEVA